MLTGQKELTIAGVRDALDALEATYRQDRKAALGAVLTPYRAKRKKLVRLLEVLVEEAGGEEPEDD